MRITIVLLVLSTLLTGCASMAREQHYSDLAAANTFDYFFPGPYNVQSFATIEEAEEFIHIAQSKIRGSIGKESAKGLASRLTGPAVTEDKPVVVAHFFVAGGRAARIDLTDKKTSLREKLLGAVSVSSVFMVFYDDRAVSISDFYLEAGYRYSANSQYKVLQYNDDEYIAEYPVGWGTDKAFKYLKKEIE